MFENVNNTDVYQGNVYVKNYNTTFKICISILDNALAIIYNLRFSMTAW